VNLQQNFSQHWRALALQGSDVNCSMMAAVGSSGNELCRVQPMSPQETAPL
jgi:hypothetical protein